MMVQISLWNSDFILFVWIPGVGLLDYIVFLFLVFWEMSILFSILYIPICLSISSMPGFFFLYILTTTYYLLSSDSSHCNRCEVISHCGFDLHFSDGFNKAWGTEKAIHYCEFFFFARPTAVENVNKTDAASALRRLQFICLLSRIKFKVVEHYNIKL